MSGADDGNTSAKWYVRRGDTVRGPMPSTKVRHYLVTGHLRMNDQVSVDRREWSAIADVPEVVPLQFRRAEDADDGAIAEQRRSQRSQALYGLFAVVLLGVFTMILVQWLGGRDPTADDGGDCAAAPAPGVNWSNCRLDAIDLRGSNLRTANLANASLVNAGLARVDLAGADLAYADLTGADLAYADLSKANLKGANLAGADLTHADMRNTDLSFADLRHARIGGARLDGANLHGVLGLTETAR